MFFAFLNLIPQKQSLEHRLASSIKEESRQTAFYVLRDFELMSKKLVLEHRLARGRERTVQFCRNKKEIFETAFHVLKIYGLFQGVGI